jgi:fatty acid desaturase
MKQRHDLSRFRKIDDRLSAAAIVGDYLTVLTAAFVAIATAHALVTLAAIVVIAGRQIAIQNLLHAAVHRSLFSTRKLNDRVDLLIGLPLFETVRTYREGHLNHHRDVTLKRPDRFDYIHAHLPAPSSPRWRRTWSAVIQPLLGTAGLRFVRVSIDACREDPRLARRLAAYWLTIGGVFWWAGWLTYLLVYWFGPLVWLYPVLDRWAALSDHYAAADDARNQRGLFYSLFLKGHEMYHAVHHAYPEIPFYRIRAAHRYLTSVGEAMEESRGIVDFAKILHRQSAQSLL